MTKQCTKLDELSVDCILWYGQVFLVGGERGERKTARLLQVCLRTTSAGALAAKKGK